MFCTLTTVTLWLLVTLSLLLGDCGIIVTGHTVKAHGIKMRGLRVLLALKVAGAQNSVRRLDRGRVEPPQV